MRLPVYSTAQAEIYRRFHLSHTTTFSKFLLKNKFWYLAYFCYHLSLKGMMQEKSLTQVFWLFGILEDIFG